MQLWSKPEEVDGFALHTTLLGSPQGLHAEGLHLIPSEDIELKHEESQVIRHSEHMRKDDVKQHLSCLRNSQLKGDDHSLKILARRQNKWMRRLINCKEIAGGGRAVLDWEKEKPRSELRASIFTTVRREQSEKVAPVRAEVIWRW